MTTLISLLGLFCLGGMITFYSAYVSCRKALRERADENARLKNALHILQFKMDALKKDIRNEKNKNLVLESLLNQKK